MSTSAKKGTKKKREVDYHDLEKMRITDAAGLLRAKEASEILESSRVANNLRHSAVMQHGDSKITHVVYTEALATFAVAALAYGRVVLFINPEFVLSLDQPVEDNAFGLMHEFMHLLMLDLSTPDHLRDDDTHMLAVEACINYMVLKRMDRKKLPTITTTNPVTGKQSTEPVGIDPQKLYKDYAKDVANPVSFEAFISTTLSCYSELKRMSKPPSNGRSIPCAHMSASGVGNEDGTGNGGLPMDPETVHVIANETLERVMQDALKGDSRARQELLDLAAVTEGTTDKASRMWGDLGLGALRGETVKTRRVEWWSRWLRQTIGSKTKQGAKLIYPRKRASVLATFGYDSPMLHRGPEKTKRVIRAIDTSGSMSEDFLKRFFEVTGKTTGVEWVDLSFDAVVMPYVAGERVYGGGGTSFGVVQDYVEGNLGVNGSKFSGHYDAVIMVTDGYAPEITPKDPKKWIWLVTPEGSMWMDGKMSCHPIDLPD
jgi:hypothetical protein